MNWKETRRDEHIPCYHTKKTSHSIKAAALFVVESRYGWYRS